VTRKCALLTRAITSEAHRLRISCEQQIVAFRARFGEAMPGKLPNLGPQDIERGVVDSTPSPQVEGLLCALLALVLNRKKPVEYVGMLPRSAFPRIAWRQKELERCCVDVS
jgi:hypothetical protein